MTDSEQAEQNEQPEHDLGDLLDFEPAPRRFKREDGWTPALQRAFIAKLAESGSPAKACEALGKNRCGVEKVYRSAGAEGFRSAWHRAVEIAQQRAAERLEAEHAETAGLKAPFVDRRRKPQFRPVSDNAWSKEDDDKDDSTVEQKLAVIESITKKYLFKVRREREARLAGEVVAADFFLRQLTVVEIGLDLLAECAGFSAFELLKSAQRDGYNIFYIADTPFSRALDNERRKQWALVGEPERPEHPPQRYLVDHGTYSLEPTEAYGASNPPVGIDQDRWFEMSMDEQRQAFADQHARDAAAQIEWEAKAQSAAGAID